MEKPNLSYDQIRALRIIRHQPAHEFQSRPFRVMSDLVSFGYAERKPDTGWSGRAFEPSFVTWITEDGKAAIDEINSKVKGPLTTRRKNALMLG